MKEFEELLKVGEVGEKIVDRILKDNGMSIFRPVFSAESNVIDRIAFTPTGAMLFFEIKTYPRRWLKPDQGIDYSDHEKYRQILDKCPGAKFFIFFVDPFEARVLSLNFRKYAGSGTREGKKVYFDLSLLKPIRDLSSYDLNRIGWIPAAQYQGLPKFFT